MANKYTLELQADATIAQRGTESEKKALRESLKSQLDSWGQVYQENNIESLWNKLGRVDLGDQETRKDIREFVANERKIKGGDAGVEFERPFQIIETNIQLAEQAAAKRDAEKGSATAAAGKAEEKLKQDAGTQGKGKSDRMKGIESRSQAYSEKQIAEYSKNIASVRARLEKYQPALLKTLEEVIKNPTYARVTQLQSAIRKLDSSVLLSPATGLAKGEPDGWFGPLTMNALQQISGSDMAPVVAPVILKSDKGPVASPNLAPAPSDAKSAVVNPAGPAATPPKTPAAVPGAKTNPEIAPKSKDTYHEDVKSVNQLFAAWKTATRGADMLSSADDRENNGQLLNASLAALAAGISDFHTKYVAGKSDAYALQNGEFLRSMNNAVALYLRGEGNVSNKHYRDPVSAESMLKGMLGDKLKAPAFPNQEQLLASLDGDTKTLIRTLIDSKMKQGKTFEQALGESLGNPTIKGAWDRVISRGLEGYEKGMTTAIKAVDVKNLSQQELASLKQLRDMYGTQGWLDFKDATKAKLIAGRNQIFAVALGIGGAALTATGIGSAAGVPMIIGASALVGGAVTTGALMVSEGKIYSGKEALTEGAINVGTFLVGGIAFRVVRSASVISKIGTKGAIGAEMAADYTLGVSVDQIRSTFQEVDISLAESLKNNIVWALLPLAIRGGSGVYSKAREALAKRSAAKMEEAAVRNALGDGKGAKAKLAEVNEDIEAVRNAEANRPTLEKSEALKNIRALKAGEGTMLGDDCHIRRLEDGRLEFTQLKTKVKGFIIPGKESAFIKDYFAHRYASDNNSARSSAQVFEAAEMGPKQVFEVIPAYANFFKALDGKLAGLKKEGDVFTNQGITVSIKDGEYFCQVKTGDVVHEQSFPKTKEGNAALSSYLQKHFSGKPQDILGTTLDHNFNAALGKSAKKEIKIGEKTYRVNGNDKDGYHLEIQNEHGGFAKVDDAGLAALKPQEIDAIIDSVFGKGASKKFGLPIGNPTKSEVFEKVKDVKVKDFLSVEALKTLKTKVKDNKVFHWIIENSVGRYLHEIGHSWHLKTLPFVKGSAGDEHRGLGKLEVLRTMFWSGRSSHGQLWSHSHAGFGVLLPTAWLPSAPIAAAVTGVTAAEWYIDGKMENKIDGFQDYVNYANEHSSEFMNNYWNIVVLGALGTAIIEGSELVGAGKEGVFKAYDAGKNLLGRLGEDGVPEPHYLSPTTNAVSRKTQGARDTIGKAIDTTVDATGKALNTANDAAVEYLDEIK